MWCNTVNPGDRKPSIIECPHCGAQYWGEAYFNFNSDSWELLNPMTKCGNCGKSM